MALIMAEPTYRAWGQRLRELRDAAGITQAELAERIGGKTKQASVSGWERGKNVPALDTAHKIARILGVSMDRLAPFDDESQAS